LGVNRHTKNKLGQVRSPISGVAPFAILGLLVPVYIRRGGIKKDQIQLLVEKVEVSKVKILLKILSDVMEEPCSPIQMLKLEGFKARAFNALQPTTAL
jgi:hypothetical protein